MNVTVYTSHGWGPCHMVKAYLSRKGIQFTERNISTDTQALQDLISLGYRTTPVTVINKENVVGYNLKKLDIALGHGVS